MPPLPESLANWRILEHFDAVLEVRNADKSFIRLLGQKISVERKALKIRHFEDISNGFTPRLHLLKVDYPINDESTLRYAGCFFFGLEEKNFELITQDVLF